MYEKEIITNHYCCSCCHNRCYHINCVINKKQDNKIIDDDNKNYEIVGTEKIRQYDSNIKKLNK